VCVCVCERESVCERQMNASLPRVCRTHKSKYVFHTYTPAHVAYFDVYIYTYFLFIMYIFTHISFPFPTRINQRTLPMWWQPPSPCVTLHSLYQLMHILVNIHIRTHIHIRSNISMCVHMHVCTYVYMYKYIHGCICMWVYMYVVMYVWMYMNMGIYVCINNTPNICMHMGTYVR